MATASCAEFLETFVLPLVVGGDMHVGAPIDAPTLEAFEQQLPHASVPLVAIDEAREKVLSQLVVKPPPCLLDVDDLKLAAAVHNLLFLAHPDAHGWKMSESRRAKVVACAQSFAARSHTVSRRRLLARHALLHNIFDIGRRDIKVSWWTGSATFEGQPVPPRLTRWSDVRRVHRDESRVAFGELFQGVDVASVIAALSRRSPLTLLLSSGRGAPHLHWEDAVFLLRDAEIARALAYRSIEGTGVDQQVKTPARYAASFDQMLERAPVAADVRTVLAFLIYLNCLLALKESHQMGESPLLATILGASQRARGVATFFAAPGAAGLVDDRLAAPPGLLADAVLTRRYDVHRRQVSSLLGASVIEGLAERLRRHLAGNDMLESSEPQEDGSSSSES
ncbi:MAG: hypothetical protein GY811_04185 [Myxococcales bacterium]|nr:hypothetical protein [Myxococcales bacterium]